MSRARLMQILASLARHSPLRTLHTICETQHQISTRKLEQYLEPIGDELAGFAFNLRQDYDQLHAANQRLETENAQIKAALANNTARRYVGDDDQRAMDDLVAAGIRADQVEIKRLEGEVARMREALEHARLFIRNGIDLGCIRMPDADTPDPAHHTLPMINAALSTADGEVAE